MKINGILDYKSNLINNKKDMNKNQFFGGKKSILKKYRTKFFSFNYSTLKKKLYQTKTLLNKTKNKNDLRINNVIFPNLSSISNNINNNIKNIYLSNSSKNFYFSQKTENNGINKYKKSKNHPHKSTTENNPIIIDGGFDTNYEDDGDVFENKNIKFVRKIDLELDDILNNNKPILNEKIKEYNLGKKYKKKNKNQIFLNINDDNKKPYSNEVKYFNQNSNDNKTNFENKSKIKKNRSEKLFNNFSRKVVYLNQKNNIISESDIINLIQKEEKKLSNNFSDTLLNKPKIRKNNQDDIGYKPLLPLISNLSTDTKNIIKSNKFSKNFPLNNDKNSLEKNINTITYYEDEKQIKDDIENINFRKKPAKIKEKRKDYSLEIKTIYNQCYEKYEFFDNVDNYKKKDVHIKKYDYYFNNPLNDCKKYNNYILDINDKAYNIKKSINTDDENININKNSLTDNSIKYKGYNIAFNKRNKSVEIKPKKDKKIFEFSRINKNKKKEKKSDLFRYLSNFNTTSDKFFDMILKSERGNNSEKEKIKGKVKNIINKNKNKKNNLKRKYNFWNIKSYNKNKIKNINKNSYWNETQNKKQKKEESSLSTKTKNDKNPKEEEKEKENKINLSNNISTSNTKSKNNIIKDNSNDLIRQLYNDIIAEKRGSDTINNVNDINIKLNEEKSNNCEEKPKFKSRNSLFVKRYSPKNYNNKESNRPINKKVSFVKGFKVKRLKTRNYQNIKFNLSNNNSKSKSKNNNQEYYIDDEEDSDENEVNKNNPYKRKYNLKEKIIFNDLSFLDDRKMDAKQKLKLIKIYKEKAIGNLYIIVKENLDENKELTLSIETLIKFLMNKSYRKYVNIMKLLTAKSRALSGINFVSNNKEIKDEEIIKYIFRIFSDETSSYYLLDKSKINNTLSFDSSSFLKNLNLGKLSHKKYLFMNEIRDNRYHQTKKKTNKKYNIKTNSFLSKFKKTMEDNKDQKNFKKFIYEEMNPDKQKQEFLAQKIKLTNELKYQIQITHKKEGKERFQILLSQIESMKNENMNDYIKFFTNDFYFYKEEIEDLINDREKEERINNFLIDLIENRDNISKRKEVLRKKLHLEDNKFESLLENNIQQGNINI